MADFSKLNDDIAALAVKVDARNAADSAKDARIAELEAQLADQQPAVDAADAALQAILTKIP